MFSYRLSSRAYIYNEWGEGNSQRLRGQTLARAYIYNEWGLRAGVLTEQTLMRARV